MTLGDRIKKARLAKNWSQKELENASGIVQAVISKLERNEQKRTTYVLDLAQCLEVSSLWLEKGIGEMRTSKDNQPLLEGAVYIPEISWELAEHYHPATLTDEERQSVAEWSWFSGDIGENGYMIRMRGNSMRNPAAPLSIEHGYALYIDPDKDPFTEHNTNIQNNVQTIVAVKLSPDDDLCIKRFYKEGGRAFLNSINPEHQTLDVTDDMIFRGVVKLITIAL